MALENLTPSNRFEAILDGQDIEPSNRKEYFMQKAVSGGGSSLPSYTSADKGKVLTIGEGSETTVEPKWEAVSGGGLKVVAATPNRDDNNMANLLLVVDGVTLTDYGSVSEFISNNRAVVFIISDGGSGVYRIMMPGSSTVIPSDNAAYYSMTVNKPSGEQTLTIGFIAK